MHGRVGRCQLLRSADEPIERRDGLNIGRALAWPPPRRLLSLTVAMMAVAASFAWLMAQQPTVWALATASAMLAALAGLMTLWSP